MTWMYRKYDRGMGNASFLIGEDFERKEIMLRCIWVPLRISNERRT